MKKVTYDSQVDAAYIYLTTISPGQVVKTIEATTNVMLDFDKNGHLVGIEVLNASNLLTEDLLKRAE